MLSVRVTPVELIFRLTIVVLREEDSSRAKVAARSKATGPVKSSIAIVFR